MYVTVCDYYRQRNSRLPFPLHFSLYCAAFATGSTVHHKLNSMSKPSLSLLSAPPHVLPPMPSLCLPLLKSLLPHRQGCKGHLEEEEVGCLGSEDEGQPEVGVASSKANNVMEVDIECRDLEL